jgi:hypothetical protein
VDLYELCHDLNPIRSKNFVEKFLSALAHIDARFFGPMTIGLDIDDNQLN